MDKTQVEKGGLYGLRYEEFTVPLVKAVQELNAENEKLKTAVGNLQLENAAVLPAKAGPLQRRASASGGKSAIDNSQSEIKEIKAYLEMERKK